MGTLAAFRQENRGRFQAGRALAILAIFLHVAVPLALQFAPASTQALFQTMICSGGEWKTIYLDAEGNPVEPAPGSASQHDCTACVHHCGSALLTALVTLPAASWVLPAPARAAHVVLTQAADGGSHPRAPPA